MPCYTFEWVSECISSYIKAWPKLILHRKQPESFFIVAVERTNNGKRLGHYLGQRATYILQLFCVCVPNNLRIPVDLNLFGCKVKEDKNRTEKTGKIWHHSIDHHLSYAKRYSTMDMNPQPMVSFQWKCSLHNNVNRSFVSTRRLKDKFYRFSIKFVTSILHQHHANNTNLATIFVVGGGGDIVRVLSALKCLYSNMLETKQIKPF